MSKADKEYKQLKELVESGKGDVDIAHALNISLKKVPALRRKYGLLVEGEIAVKQEVADLKQKKLEDVVHRKQTFTEIFTATPRYKSLKSRLSPADLEWFVDKWATYSEQFDNPTATEEDTIELLILTKLRMESNDREIASLQKQNVLLEQQLSTHGDEPDLEDPEVRAIFQQMQSVRSLLQQALKLESDLTERHQQHLKALNATREQREKTKGISGDTFMSLVYQLTQEDLRARIGKQAALARMAAENKTEKFSKPHTFMNGESNPIILDGGDP